MSECHAIEQKLVVGLYLGVRGTIPALPPARGALFRLSIEYLHIELKCSTIFNLRILLPQGRPIGDTLLAFLPTVGDALVLSLPLLLFTRRRWVVFIPLFLFDLFCLAQSCYARVYEDVMPYSSFLLFDNVNGVLLNSVRGLLRWRDVTLFVPTLLLLAAYLLYFGKQRSYPSPRIRWITAVVSLVIALAAYGGRSYQIYHRASADRESPWTPSSLLIITANTSSITG